MNNLQNILRSRTVWTFILLFIINGIAATEDTIPPRYLPAINAILTLLGIYFRVYPQQQQLGSTTPIGQKTGMHFPVIPAGLPTVVSPAPAVPTSDYTVPAPAGISPQTDAHEGGAL